MTLSIVSFLPHQLPNDNILSLHLELLHLAFTFCLLIYIFLLLYVFCLPFSFLPASFGGNHLRQRRETTKKPSQEDLLLVQSIQITDKFGFDKQQQSKSNSNHMGYDANETVFISSEAASQGFCVNAIGECFSY